MGQANTKHKLVRRRFIFEQDYAIFAEWWTGHGNEKVPLPEHLSDTGIVIQVNGEPQAMVFMYHTNSGICISEFFVDNPNAPIKVRYKAVKRLIQSIKDWTKNAGYVLNYLSTNIHGLVKMLQKDDFFVTDTNMQHCFYKVVA